ncbi:MAG: transcription termination/antitermination protein NusG [Candidatus Daviesbacteria bacterium]|nr:transcription termination/antitermination protein NusG [Candidatus Daviesbacteria bacterium]
MNDDDLKNKQSLTADDANKQSLPTDDEGQTNTPADPSQIVESVEEVTESEAPAKVTEVTSEKSEERLSPNAASPSEGVTSDAGHVDEPESGIADQSGTTEEPVLKEEAEVQASEQSEEVPVEQTAAESKDETQPAEPTTDEQPVTPIVDENPNAKWYVVHTYSGHENKVAATLRQRIESEHLQDKILDILVPTQDKIEIRSGKKATIKEKIFPGYILVKMILEDTSWLAVRTTQGVTSFVGIGNKPTPISNAEVATIVKFTTEQAPTFKQVFASDDTVRIVEGPFAEFIGKVDSVDEEKGKVRVLVSIFGRETPVELDFLQVQKI